MQITDKLDVKVLCWDIETLKAMFYARFKNIDTGKVTDFEISRRKNQLHEMIDFLRRNNDSYFVGYNTINFDGPVITGIMKKYKYWMDLPVEQIVHKIFALAQRSIYLSNNESFQDYREEDFPGTHIDVYRVNHFDNKNRMVG